MIPPRDSRPLAVSGPLRRLGRYELRYNDRGEPIYSWTWTMPRLGDDSLLDCLAYIYPSRSAAQAGEKLGGSGFLLSVPSEKHPPFAHGYMATADHVIQEIAKQGGEPCIRINSSFGEPLRYADTKVSDWIPHPGADVAIASIGALLPRQARFRVLAPVDFLTDEIAQEHDVGPGDDCFMISRFVDVEGTDRNQPILRFGNISAMPGEPIPMGDEEVIEQPAYLVEMRSLGGHSGSPVFVMAYVGMAQTLMEHALADNPDAPDYPKGGTGPWLLGIDVGHFPIKVKVKMKEGRRLRETELKIENSGLAVVVPVARIAELLNDERFVALRDTEDQRLTDRKARLAVELDSASDESQPGPEPERLKIDLPMDQAVKKMFKAGKPPRRD